MVMKFRGWLQLEVRCVYLATICHSCCTYESYKCVIIIFPPEKMTVFVGILSSACLSVYVSICVQNTNFCQSAGGGSKSHLVTAIVVIVKTS